uniref:ATP synthase F0 subunit 8 n=1 Tax=Amynthas bubonis TaxID=3229772 RepID=A0AAU7YPC7_9ANNE
MPHLSPMSWLMAISTFWIILMLFTSNIWWTNLHTFEANIPQTSSKKNIAWPWT